MALTADQITQIRNTIGDVVVGFFLVSDVRLNVLFTEALEDLPQTTLQAAYERLGILANQVDVTDGNNLITEHRKQRFDMLLKVIERLERQGSRASGSLTTGRMRLGLDAREDS